MWRRLVPVPFRFHVERRGCFLSTESDTLTAEEQKKVAEKLTNFFKRAEESIAKQQAETETHLSSTKSVHSTARPDRPDEGDSSDLLGKVDKPLDKKQHPTAVSFVPWTMSCFLQEMNIRKLPARRNPNVEQSFATLLRNSPFIQLGDFESREVIGVVIENVNETDLYIDFGGKFHCVCPQPAEQHYPRGSLVRLRLRDPEMTNKFMINTKGISLCEADATLLGPYRGRVVRNPTDEELTVPTVYGDSRSAPRPATENDSESATDYSSGDAVQKASDYPPNFNEYVLKSTQQLPVGVSTTVKGYDFNNGLDYDALLNSFASIGFQATQFGRAVDVVNMMLDKRAEQPVSLEQRRQAVVYTESHPLRRMSNNCTVFLSYTSNMVSCGVRDIIRFIVQYDMGCNWTPSKMIDRLGKEINHPDSIYYWCHVMKIGVENEIVNI
ncbi:hypothetical protein EG68_05877 [Paragonimus skrjabini miyazakii]|uniref:Uncharacterized protein n=1 Tax=Paragonimus skrjabini miyazakii TaxID=59628 RepID=A0A8S9YWE5_9TREM|nr:hypothetical protein EG68_05877 [Paragonimus skrjabini miyazakii]